jgi:hypothetical protein
MFWMRDKKEKDSYKKHFTWASYQQMPEEWEGRVKATTTPINKAVKEQGQKFTTATNQVDSSIAEMERSLEAINQDIRTAVDTGKEDMILKLGDFQSKAAYDFNLVKETGDKNE